MPGTGISRRTFLGAAAASAAALSVHAEVANALPWWDVARARIAAGAIGPVHSASAILAGNPGPWQELNTTHGMFIVPATVHAALGQLIRATGAGAFRSITTTGKDSVPGTFSMACATDNGVGIALATVNRPAGDLVTIRAARGSIVVQNGTLSVLIDGVWSTIELD